MHGAPDEQQDTFEWLWSGAWLPGLPERVRAMTRDEVTVDVKAVDITRPVGKPEGEKK